MGRLSIRNMSIKGKIVLSFLIIITVLSTVNVIGIVTSINHYKQYNKVVENIMSANGINSQFKADIDSEMFEIVAGKVRFEDGKQYQIIQNATESIYRLMARTNTIEGRTKLDVILRTINTLTHYVDRMGDQIHQKKRVEENEKVLEEIRGVSELVDDSIREFMLLELGDISVINEQIQHSSERWLVTEVIIISLMFLFSVLAVWLIATAISRPIHELHKMTASVGEGNLDVRVESRNEDEITALGRSFNVMTERIKEMMEKERREQENLKKSELKALQAQINPHFLYNTLDAIVWMAEANRKDEVIYLVNALSSFFRTTLSKGKDWIPVRNEIEHVQSYLAIQKVRYRDILDYQVEIDEAVMGFTILKLTLQPIVENALYHGIKHKRDRGLIHIKGGLDGDNQMVFTVEDNGAGMSPKRLEEVRSEIEDVGGDIEEKESGFGLNNVQKRIRLYYGAPYGLNIESDEKNGTRVTIVIPTQKVNGEKG